METKNDIENKTTAEFDGNNTEKLIFPTFGEYASEEILDFRISSKMVTLSSKRKPKFEYSLIDSKLKPLCEYSSIIKTVGKSEHSDTETNSISNNQESPRKRIVNVIPDPSTWKVNLRKKAHQSGKSYTNRRGKFVPEKKVKNLKNCLSKCKYKCKKKISDDERLELHKAYYSLPSATEKRDFLLSTTERSHTARPTKKVFANEHNLNDYDIINEEDFPNTNSNQSRRTFSFKYFFHIKGEKVQVCKDFFLGTLSISQKPVYTAHSTKNAETNTATPDKRGKSVGSRRVAEGNADFARQHIMSFPKVESHRCIVNTTREYLQSNLSISKMYHLYKEKCAEEKIDPVKESMYHKIFVTEFNLGFHNPKDDRCEWCEKFELIPKAEVITSD